MTQLPHSPLQRWPHHILKCRMNSLLVHGLNHMNKRSKGEIADWGRGGENKQTLAFWFTPQRLEKTISTPFLKAEKKHCINTCRWQRNNLYICKWLENVSGDRGCFCFVFLTVPNIICYSWQPRLITLWNTDWGVALLKYQWGSVTLLNQRQTAVYSTRHFKHWADSRFLSRQIKSITKRFYSKINSFLLF